MSNDTTETTNTPEEVKDVPTLTAQQEINALRNVHEFLSSFDRVPGFLANKWSQALDTVAVVANSLIAKAKANGTLTEAGTDTTADATDTEHQVEQ